MVMVIVQHVGQAYGPTGGAWLIQEPNRAAVLGPFFTVNRSFGMSLFFMIAGYFMVISADRKGAVPFLKDRVLRLGLPLLAWCVFMEFLQAFVFAVPANGYTRGVVWPVEVAHMWFVEHLLIYRRDLRGLALVPARPDGHRLVALPRSCLVGDRRICAGARHRILCRPDLVSDRPLGVSVRLHKGRLGRHAARDLGLFIIGALAYRRGWLLGFSSRAGRIWLGVGVLLAALWYVYSLAFPQSLPTDEVLRTLPFAVWESLLCVSMCIGLAVVSRDLWNSQSLLGKKMAQGQYATYVFHVGVVLLFQWALLALVAAPFVKFVLASLLSVPAAFLLGYWVRKPLRL